MFAASQPRNANNYMKKRARDREEEIAGRDGGSAELLSEESVIFLPDSPAAPGSPLSHCNVKCKGQCESLLGQRAQEEGALTGVLLPGRMYLLFFLSLLSGIWGRGGWGGR